MTLNKTVCGLNINYTERGEGDLVVLLHGWGSNITLFEQAIAILERKYKVVAMDMPGFGESEEPKEPWCVDDYVDFLLEFLEDYKPDKVTLLGHSFGGRVIIKLCSRELPFEVEKVILVGAMQDCTALCKDIFNVLQAKLDKISVIKPVKILVAFDAVTDGVAEVQQHAQAALPLVGADDVRLDGTAGVHHVLDALHHALASAATIQQAEKRLVPDAAVLDDFAHSVVEKSLRKSI